MLFSPMRRVQYGMWFAMRLWSLHPSLLDRVGLVALWREALLAQKVLTGATKGYRHHPQLDRFRQSRHPSRAIASYLWSVADEAKERGYAFDVSKIAMRRGKVSIPVTDGQLAYELMHLKQKVRQRDPERLQLLSKGESVRVNSIFKAVNGPIEPWERIRKANGRTRAGESAPVPCRLRERLADPEAVSAHITAHPEVSATSIREKQLSR